MAIDWTSYFLGAASGIVVGVAATWFGTFKADQSTDQRRNEGAEGAALKKFRECEAEVPELFKEVREQLARKPLARVCKETGETAMPDDQSESWLCITDKVPRARDAMEHLVGLGYAERIERKPTTGPEKHQRIRAMFDARAPRHRITAAFAEQLKRVPPA